MIRESKILSDKDWLGLNGNDLYICMLKNKVKVSPEDKNTSQELFDDIKEYLDGSVGSLVYYDVDNVYGHITVDIYFESVMDKENFMHFYKTAASIYQIKK